jgi:predicted regulator of Ras-like GTPase activity (Roadblock/LC7/MglB family)
MNALHTRPLSFAAEQQQEIDRLLLRLADKISAPLVLVADVSGRLVLYRGRLSSSQSTALAALAAGSFAAGSEMGNFLGLRGKNSFRHQLHEGFAANLYTLAIGQDLLLIIAFTGQTTLGLVRVYAEQTQRDLMKVVQVASIQREHELANPTPMDDKEEFGDQLRQQLDDLFSI